MLISYTDLDPLVYAAAFSAQTTRYVLLNEAGTVMADFKVKMHSGSDWRAYDWDNKQVCTAYSRSGCIKAMENLHPGTALDKYTHLADSGFAIQSMRTMLDAVNKASKADQYVGCLSMGQCFRHDIATLDEYKGNRRYTERPQHYHAVRSYLLEQRNATPVEFYEADDYMSMAQWNDPEGVIISSIDKDLRMVPGRKYIHNKRIAEAERYRYITFDVGIRNFYCQMLSGDRVDNIRGLKGVVGNPGWGEKTAAKAIAKLDTLREVHEFVAEEYDKKYGSEYEYKHWKMVLFEKLEEKDCLTKQEIEEYEWLKDDHQAKEIIKSSGKKLMEETGQLLWMLRSHKDPLWSSDWMIKEVIKDG